jgi:hypothetical protein
MEKKEWVGILQKLTFRTITKINRGALARQNILENQALG